MPSVSRLHIGLFAVVLAGVVLALQAITFSPRADAAGATVSIGSQALPVGGQGSVDLQALNMVPPGLGAWEIDVVYNSAVVSVLNCNPMAGSICNPAYNSITIRDVGANAFGLVGDTTLASITFHCDQAGVSALTISIVVLADATIGNPQDITAATQNGSVTCGPTPTPCGLGGCPTATPTATSTVAPTPTPCSPGPCISAVAIGSIVRDVGQQGTVSLDALGMAPPGLGAWTIDVMYDPSVVAVKACVPVASIGVCNPAFNVITIRDVGATAFGHLGDVLLADITFTCNANGVSPLTIRIDVLADATIGNPQPISAVTRNGNVTCGQPVGGISLDPASPAVQLQTTGGSGLDRAGLAGAIAAVTMAALTGAATLWYWRRRA
jgi:hypothetical protein